MAGKQQNGKKLIVLDLIFYAALPYIVWKYGRETFGDYAAMLISTIPGFIYTSYRFFVERQFNITGLFILGSLVLGTTVNLLSGAAEQMLWNGVYLGLFYVAVHLAALTIRRPISLYFAVDFVYLQGQARKDSKALFFQKDIFKWFQVIQAIFIVRGLVMAGLNAFLLQKFGVDGYDKMLILRQAVGWLFGLLITGMFFYTNVPIQKFLEKRQDNSQDRKSSTAAEKSL